MSVNQMNVEDVYQFLNDLHMQVTGRTSMGPVDPSDFISVATTVLQQGTDKVYNALMNTITKTVFSTRPYSRQFGGMIVDNAKWGGVIRKVSFGDTPAVANKPYNLPADGQSVDHYVINRGEVLETHFYGSDIYQDVFSVFREQLIEAFNGPEQLGSFIAAKTNEINNKWVQWTEDMTRALLMNMIIATIKQGRTESSVHLISEYNAVTGITPALTINDIFKPAIAKPFWEFVRAKVKTISREFEQRSGRFQVQIMNQNTSMYYAINRHTPVKNQKLYMLAPYMDLMETSTLTEAFHNDYLKYADVEKVAFWQSMENSDRITLGQYTYMDNDGVYQVASNEVSESYILGVLFDEDAAVVNIKDTIVMNTPMNARGLYYDTWLTAHAQYTMDTSEKICVFKLD